MTRYARPGDGSGKREAEDGSSWDTLKQTIPSNNQLKKRKKLEKLKEKKKLEKAAKKNVTASNPEGKGTDDMGVKKLKNTNHSGENTSSGTKLGKGNNKFSRMDTDTRRASRTNVHRDRRAAQNPCFVCRSTKHKASNCPKGSEKGLGNCFKCESKEHTSSSCPRTDIAGFPYAKCFICSEKGHLSRACPDNPRGLYPNGGSCMECGSVEHFIRFVPSFS